MQRVTSRDNPRLSEAAHLVSSSRERRKTGRCVLEGVHLAQAFVARYGVPDFAIVLDASLRDARIAAFVERLPSSRVIVVDPALWTALPQIPAGVGVVAVVRVPEPRATSPDDFVVLLDRVQDPGNVGTILRSAAGAGVQQVMLSRGCAFAWAPKVLRAGQGAHFHVDVHEDVDLLEWSRVYRGKLVVAVASRGASLYDTDLSRPLAFAIGNEGVGLDPELASAATHRVTIPMPGGIESLNAAVAASICLFETVRRDVEGGK